ncbi:MAG TPA: ABC transporter permease [Candidatus Deferrimicrobiaceae bacterium]|nr:ABC transporter permease [Candidatus Deferrimicrobiaceae bacterium]
MTFANELEKIYYFMKRDIISFSTYKTNILILVLTAVFGALSFSYLGTSATSQSVLQMYNMDLTTYLIIGLAFSTYLNQALTLVQKTINPWALEEVLVSPTRLSTFIVGSSLWGFIWSTAVVAVYLSIGVLFFGVNLSINVLGTLIVLALGIGTFLGFSMIGAGILILTKQGDPVTALITIATSLFGNVLFPPQIMPAALQAISYVIPQYYFFTSIRLMLTGWSIPMVLPNLLILGLMCAIILPLGYGVYAWCLKTARKNGTLSWF